MSNSKKILFFTTAPSNYDGFSTVEICPIAGKDVCNGKIYRLCSVLPKDKDWQFGRNHSGLHPCLNMEEFKDSLSRNFIKPSAYKCEHAHYWE